MGQPAPSRLPETVRPHLYEIHLSVIPQEKRFEGEVTVHVEVQQSTKTLTLHALDLQVQEAGLSGNGRTEGRLSRDAAAETLTLSFDSAVGAGPAQLYFRFSGRLNRQLRGLYEAHAEGETFAFTQFEPTDARRMFPCFDEPAFKARFRLAVTCPAHLTALSNMPVQSERREGSVKTVYFEETPVMSTYLLALAVARLEAREMKIAGTRVAVWTLPGQQQLTDFALKVTGGVLPLLNDYFDLPYPYPKLDLVSAPDFAMGAMENWGAIFFRDSRLLLDEGRSSALTQRAVANVIAHEIVHQWFGNLVTMKWWDNLWLNESFATWLACKVVDQWRPEWNSWAEFQQEKEAPLAIDALKSTRSIRTQVSTSAQIEEMFDPLSYEKGAACLRMFEEYLGELPFREGVRRYIKKYQFQNASAEDLWQELDAASGRSLSAVARDWFTQPGYPLLTLRSQKGDFSRLTLEQRRFFSLETPEEKPAGVWAIPLNLKYQDRRGIQRHQVLLEEAAASLTLPAEGKIAWIAANAGESGFFRVQYDPPLREALQGAGLRELAAQEKLGFLSHLWALAQRGELDIADFMEALCRFKGDATRVLVEAMVTDLEAASNHLLLAEDRPLFEALVREIFEPIWKELGWDARPEEDDERKLTRAAALWALGALAVDEDILPETPRRLTLYWTRPDSLEPTLATPLIRLCARTDGGSLFDRFIQRFQSAPTPEERDRYLRALADYKRPALARKLLELALSESVRAQDVWKPVQCLLANPAVQAETWAFVKANWQALKEKGGSVGAHRMIAGAEWLWRPEWREEVKTFFSDPDNRVEAAERTLAQTLEFIQIGIRFKARQQEALSRWLKARHA